MLSNLSKLETTFNYSTFTFLPRINDLSSRMILLGPPKDNENENMLQKQE